MDNAADFVLGMEPVNGGRGAQVSQRRCGTVLQASLFIHRTAGGVEICCCAVHTPAQQRGQRTASGWRSSMMRVFFTETEKPLLNSSL